jgi:uncharacterized protein (UPF0276 family)
MKRFPVIGHGIGLRPPHYQPLLRALREAPTAAQRPVDWVEIISENFIVEGGNPRAVLRDIRAEVPVVMHGVSLSLGSVDPLDPRYLDDLEALARELEPPWISDHLCWSSFGGHTGHDLWPLPFTEEALAHVSARVLAVQDRLRRPILVENVSSYLQFGHSTMPEWEFLSALVARTGCGLLLDVNNVFVSAHNHGFAAQSFLEGVPRDSVGQFHLAGHRDQGTHLLDTHDRPVCPGVWDLYRQAVGRFGEVSTLIERDDDIPPLEVLLAELRQARDIAREVGKGASPVEWARREDIEQGEPPRGADA